MTKDIKDIHSYYSPNDLYNKIIDGLHKLGKDLSSVTLDDLQPVDEFHIRGDTATRELIELAGFTPDMHILDVERVSLIETVAVKPGKAGLELRI